MTMYQVYASEAVPEPESPGLLERIEPPQPAGDVHTVVAGNDATMCGLPTEGMLAFPMHVWESFADTQNNASADACPQCVATIAARGD